MKHSARLWALLALILVLPGAATAQANTPTPLADAQAKTASPIVGDWLGTLTAGGATLHIVLHFTAGADGMLGGTLDSPDQNANGIPLGAVTDTAGAVHAAIPAIGGAFDGKLGADGTQIAGTWTQGPNTLPLTLSKAAPGIAAPPPAAMPAPTFPTLGTAADSGKFLLTINDTAIGTDTFTADASGSSDGTATVSLGGKTTTLHEAAQVKNGILTQATTDGGPVGWLTLTAAGAQSKVFAAEAGRTVTLPQKLPARVYAFGNFTPHLLTPLLRAYDRAKGGPQAFTLVLIDGLAPTGLPTIAGTLTREATKPATVGGKTISVTRYTLTITGGVGNIDIQLTADDKGNVLLWNVPGQKYIAVRDGYQSLLTAQTPTDPTLSKPTYAVTEDKAVPVYMRDGVALVADVYRPDAPGTFPIILQRTPYGRGNALEATFYAKRGYVFVAQDVRGRGDSEGAWTPFLNEARDGYDTIKWCVKQPWSSGNVGMIGGSYLGFVQWAAARENNPHLKCLIPIVSPPDPFFNIPYAYGAFLLYGASWWSRIVDGKTVNAPPKFRSLDKFKTLPLANVDLALFGHHIAFFQQWMQHPTNDFYWQMGSFNAQMKNIGPLPALHISGWFDGDGIGTKHNYAAMVASGHKDQRLIYGPWEHGVDAATQVGELRFGPTALRDLDTLYLRWFDHWLKGVNNGVDREKPVQAFLMGANQWRSFTAWPPKEATMQKWYLHAGKALSPLAPSKAEAADHYMYDPAHPWVNPALVAGLKSGQDVTTLDIAAGEHEPGILAFSSTPLKRPVVVAGPISVHLSAATSARDTDWIAILTDVRPDGKSLALCEGIIRARYRHSFSQPQLLQPGEIVGYDIDLWALGNVFAAGHRIRIDVLSSDFPSYDRNLNTGGDIAHGTAMVTARQTVFHDAAHPSYVTLPALPR